MTALHVLGHLAGLPAALAADRRAERPWDDHGSGRGARALLIAGALVGGLVIALLAESQFGAWAQLPPPRLSGPPAAAGPAGSAQRVAAQVDREEVAVVRGQVARRDAVHVGQQVRRAQPRPSRRR